MRARSLILALVCVLAPFIAHAQTAVTGNLKDVGVANASGSNTYVRFTLIDYGAQIPRIINLAGNVVFNPIKDFKPDVNGNISGVIQGNDTISPPATKYQVCIFYQGAVFRCNTYIINGATFNLNTAVPLNTSIQAGANQLVVLSFPFTQVTPASTWTIPHNFNDPNAYVQVFSTTHQIIYPDTVNTSDPNNAVLTFVTPTAGFAIAMHAGSINIATNQPNAIISNSTAPQTVGSQPVSFQGPISAGNINGKRIVDGVRFSTIDTAVADCGSAPCNVEIPWTYAGLESSHLVTSTLGYIFYKPVANETVIDNRYITGTSRPNYSYTFNGQNLGQLSRFGVTQSCSSPLDSCVGATITNFISNTMPLNNGTQTGMVSIAAVTGSITRGASGARVAAHEGYVSLSATSADTPFADVRGFTSSINIDRATSVQGAVTAAGYTAAAHTNISTSGATIGNAYGFDGQLQTVGTSRNYSYHSVGNFLFENGAAIDAVDSGGTPQHILTFRGDNGIDIQPLCDSCGFNFKTQNGTGLFTVTSANIVSRIAHVFSTSISINGGSSLATSNQSGTGSLCMTTNCALVTPTIGGGSTINKVLLGTATLTYTAIAANTCQEQPFTLTGALTSGIASASPTTNLGNVSLNFSARVSASDTLQVKVCNVTTGSLTPTAVSWNAMVTQ